MNVKSHVILRFASFIVGGLVLAACIHTVLFIMSPASGTKEYKELLIPEGSSFRTVAVELKKNGLITDKTTFIMLGKLKGVTRKIRAGFYSFNTGMRPLDIIEILRRGKIVEYQVVLPEGIDMEKVADAISKSGVVSRDEFMAKAKNPDYVQGLGLAGDTLEGYLFPATYFFPKGITVDGMIKQMVSKYHAVFNDSLKERAAELGMTELQVVTMASLIERESAVDAERLLISAVFHNRLKRGIPLQCDPCVIYALQRHGRYFGDLNKGNLRFKDPYNTYVYKGLPPGPIGNPGKQSIVAALYPADVDYIYFVSKNDGTHIFSNNLSAHNRAVHQYQVLAKMEKLAKMQNLTTATEEISPDKNPQKP